MPTSCAADHDGWLLRLQDAFGTRGQAFAMSQLNQLIAFSQDSGAKFDGTRLDAMIAMVEGCAPENELQAALAVQMAITHFVMVQLMRRTSTAEHLPQFESLGNMSVKFARTFALQTEALAKLQRGGQQIVKVVHVYSGGQAIVGNVQAGKTSTAQHPGGVANETRNRPHAKGELPADASQAGTSLQSQDPERAPVLCAGCSG